MLGDFTIHSVDPREAGWAPVVMFKRDMRFRIQLPEKITNWMAKMVACGQFQKMLSGTEGLEWLIEDNEVYCASITFLMMARLSEDIQFEELVGRIEERNDCEE